MSTLQTITTKLGRVNRRAKKAPPPPPAAIEAVTGAGVTNAQVRDDPIMLPADDLLGMDFYAQRLVEYVMKIHPPFTVGIYGEWGAGKTSLVQLLHHHVEEREPGSTLFIFFSAWQYKAADELWRALILAIAQKLYNYQPVADAAARTPSGLWHFLQGTAWSDEDDKPMDPYGQLVRRLDATLYGGIARGRNAQSQLNDQEMTVAALRAATTALESVSPLFGTILKLFGLDDKIDFVSLLHSKKNEATRNRIDSIEMFRNEIEQMFEQHTCGKRVCVFIDDLDRVMPDVALDLMEAIKSLLDGVSCTFIFAADQQLIGQGLKARFRDVDAPAGMQPSEFYDKKGREYFEKIVQLGIPVPEPTLDDAHRYIAAQFPAWAAASDLLVTACGINPRRLKQYCVLADYKLAVWKKQQEQQIRR